MSYSANAQDHLFPFTSNGLGWWIQITWQECSELVSMISQRRGTFTYTEKENHFEACLKRRRCCRGFGRLCSRWTERGWKAGLPWTHSVWSHAMSKIKQARPTFTSWACLSFRVRVVPQGVKEFVECYVSQVRVLNIKEKHIVLKILCLLWFGL